MHASERDFSYYSELTDNYTRIDLLFVDHNNLDNLTCFTIEQISISEHALITVSFLLPGSLTRNWSSRLNGNLLDYVSVVAKVTETLTHNFPENAMEEVRDGVVWEGHKAVVHGMFIALGTKLKKEK